jgi:hypothetical protein
MHTLDLILLIVATICFGLAAFGGIATGRVNLIALGLLAWVLTVLIPALT